MANEFEDPADKTEDPTQHRIDEYRKKGQIASSKEMTSVLLLGGVVFCLLLTSTFMYETLYEFIEWLYKFELEKIFEKDTFNHVLSKSIITFLKIISPVFLTSICLGYITQVMQFGFIFSSETLKWDISKINPLNGFKRLFSKKTLFDTFKGLFKFLIILSITYSILSPILFSFRGFLDSDLTVIMTYTQDVVVKLVFGVLLGMLVLALIDFAWEKYTYLQKLKMSKRELKEETKEREGNPEIKQRIRTIQREMARKRMIKEIPKADVVVTNPTHISVAIKYDREKMFAPVIVAKGADHLALKIREIAKQNKVPMVENIPLARALYSTVKLGDVVPKSLYKAVAEVLAYVYRLRKKQKAVS